MSEYVRKQPLVEWLKEQFKTCGDDVTGCEALNSVMLKIVTGAFDAPDGEIQRLKVALDWVKRRFEEEWTYELGTGEVVEEIIVKFEEALSTNEPTGAERAAIRPEVQWFAEQMERTLRANDHKGGWENENIYWLFGRLKEESTELLRAVDLVRDLHDDPKKIISEAADVANFAMMIADIARRINAPEGDENE